MSDEVVEFLAVPLQTGGFIFKVTPMARLPVPVTVSLLHTEIESGQTLVVKSDNTFFNSSPINYIAFREEVPFDRFRVDVGLESEEVAGPMISMNVEYGKHASVDGTLWIR